jgi:hypothetical protein
MYAEFCVKLRNKAYLGDSCAWEDNIKMDPKYDVRMWTR